VGNISKVFRLATTENEVAEEGQHKSLQKVADLKSQ